MRKKKWILAGVAAVVVVLVMFAPMPVPHFADFTTVRDTDGQKVDVTVKARFVHFKPLFFRYGKDAGYFPVGSVKIYDNATGEEICDLKLDAGTAQSLSGNTYMALVNGERRTIDKTTGEMPFMTIYTGNFIWDDSCGNMAVAVQGMVYDFEKQASDPEADAFDVFFAYMASREDLSHDELVELFYEYRGLFQMDEQ